MVSWLGGGFGRPTPKDFKEKGETMSRASQFLEYINKEYEPDYWETVEKYTDIVIDENLKKIRKEYQKKKRKKESISVRYKKL